MVDLRIWIFYKSQNLALFQVWLEISSAQLVTSPNFKNIYLFRNFQISLLSSSTRNFLKASKFITISMSCGNQMLVQTFNVILCVAILFVSYDIVTCKMLCSVNYNVPGALVDSPRVFLSDFSISGFDESMSRLELYGCKHLPKKGLYFILL